MIKFIWLIPCPLEHVSSVVKNYLGSRPCIIGSDSNFSFSFSFCWVIIVRSFVGVLKPLSIYLCFVISYIVLHSINCCKITKDQKWNRFNRKNRFGAKLFQSCCWSLSSLPCSSTSWQFTFSLADFRTWFSEKFAKDISTRHSVRSTTPPSTRMHSIWCNATLPGANSTKETLYLTFNK